MNLYDETDVLGNEPAPHPIAAQSAPDEREDWGVFASYLLDKCEGDTISEEGLQRALHSMFHDPHYGPLFRRESEQHSAPAASADRPIAECQRGLFETWAMETKHPVFCYIGEDWLDHGDDPNTYANDYIQGAWVMWQHLNSAWQRTQSAGAPESSIYVEFRQCDKCQHGGINDAATGVAACHDCDWTGSEPVEDKCPGCHRENCMAAACPKCGARYVLLASEDIAAPAQPAVQREWPDDEIVDAWKWCEENGGTPAEFLSHSLLVKRSRVLGRPLTWREAIELTAMTTNMPDEERDKLLAIDDEPDAAAQDQGEVRRLREALERIAKNAAWHTEIGNRPDLITLSCWVSEAHAALSASAEGKV